MERKINKKILYFLIFFLNIILFFWLSNKTFALTTTATYVWTASDIWWWSFPWVNPNNAIWNTTTTAASSTISTRNAFTNNFSLRNFNLTWAWLPSNAIINGITVNVERMVSNNRMLDTKVQLTKNWTIWVWSNLWTSSNWPTTKTISTYGWATNLWWTTWTAVELLSNNFWVILQYQYTRNWTENVNIYRVNVIIDYTIPAPVVSPGWVSTWLQIWLKSSAWTSTNTDWNPLVTWNDQSWNWFNAWWWVSPTYLNSTNNNLNYYPLIDFNGTTQYLQNLSNWAYTNSYFMVIVPDNQVSWTMWWQVPFWFDCNSWVLNTWTCWLSFAWTTLWAFTAAINDEVITHAIWASTSYRSAQIWVASYQASKPMLIWINENAWANNADIYEKWLKVDNYTVNTYQKLSTANYSIWKTLDATYPFFYDWKIVEIVNYSNRISDSDRIKIESYLSLKYWITLKNWTQNYIASDWTTIYWSTTTAWAYNNNIFWIWRDNLASLTNVKSKSVNDDWIIVLEAIWEWTNMNPSFVDIADKEFLTISNNNLWNTWTMVDSPAWYDRLSRIWRVQEIWEVGTVNLDFDVWNLNFDVPNLNAWTSYYFLYDTNNNNILSDDTPQIMTNVWWNIWRISWFNLNHDREFTIATQASANNIPTNILLSNNIINENLPSWTTIGTFSTVDADIWDSHVYTFIAWAWDSDNTMFTITWNTLTINESADYEIKPSYSIRVQTDDWNWWKFQKIFTININDIWETYTSIIDFENSWKYSVTSWVWNRNTINPFEWSYSIESNNWWLNNTQSCFVVNHTFSNTWTIDFKYNISSQLNSDYLRFYIDNVEQQNWSWIIPWSTYLKTDIAPWLHQYKWCYIKDWAGSAWTDNAYIDYIIYYNTAVDSTAPVISSINYASWSLLPWWNHNLIINYTDLESWINTSSDIITLNKWNWTAWWADISSSWLNLWSKIITATSVTYPTNNLSFGKYRYNFQISDNSSNSSSTWAVFYIDVPELIINTWSLDIWNISAWALNFSTWEIIITVKTVWAWFKVEASQDTWFTSAWWIIINWNWVKWFWYDFTPYTWINKNINSNKTIALRAKSINIDWNKNTYTYSIKIWTLIDYEQAAGDYESDLSFYLILDY